MLPLVSAIPQLPFGRGSVGHYGMSCRPSVFSHNELVCTIAEDPRDASYAILKACYEDMKEMIREEEDALKTVANLVRGKGRGWMKVL